MVVTVGLLILGLCVLTAGAELLVRGASTLSKRLGVPSLIVGLTVVAFGTSAPEMAVSIKSAISGQADVALGNVVGSNIFNVLFILGLSAVIIPLAVQRQLVRIDVPIMIAISMLLLGAAWDGNISRFEGGFLFLGIIVYTALQIWLGMRESGKLEDPASASPRTAGGFVSDIVLAVVGLGLLVLGARWFVASAIDIARVIGVSELVIGLTLVAAGTSLPEVAASTMAALRGERDLAVGNVVGSNIFNILAVLGASSLIAPQGVGVAPSAMGYDLPVMVLVAVACLPIFLSGMVISRIEGACFLMAYVVYTTLLILLSGGKLPAGLGSDVVIYGGVPFVLLYVTWEFYRSRSGKNEQSHYSPRLGKESQ